MLAFVAHRSEASVPADGAVVPELSRTAREEAAIADIERRVLWLSMGSALGLIVILSLASRFVVVRPLRRLTRATAALKRGDKTEILTPSSDELGELTQAFIEMSHAIETREQRIGARNRDMLRILDNAEDGSSPLPAPES